jgi:hypothetical protein
MSIYSIIYYIVSFYDDDDGGDDDGLGPWCGLMCQCVNVSNGQCQCVNVHMVQYCPQFKNMVKQKLKCKKCYVYYK